MAIDKLIINEKTYYASEAIIYLLEEIKDLKECVTDQKDYIDALLDEKQHLEIAYKEAKGWL